MKTKVNKTALTSLLNFSLFLALTFPTRDVKSHYKFDEIIRSESTSVTEKIIFDIQDHLGNTVRVPIVVIKGASEGPVFTIVTGVHGYEYPPIVATQQLLAEIDEMKLKGTAVLIPIANLDSFFARTPFVNPKDGLNLNKVFPGNPDGTVTERIAHLITSRIIPVSDVFLDIHVVMLVKTFSRSFATMTTPRNKSKQSWRKSCLKAVDFNIWFPCLIRRWILSQRNTHSSRLYRTGRQL